jgi:hypothetical protein
MENAVFRGRSVAKSEKGKQTASSGKSDFDGRWKVLIASRLASALKVDSKLGGHLPPMRLIQVPV